jgi:exonuclease III
MKIVSWNMNQFGRWTTPDLAWKFLIDEVRPDIALLQEVIVPEQYVPDTFFMYSYTDEKEPRWGTAIYINRNTVAGFNTDAAEISTKELLGELSELGKAVVAEIALKDGQTYTFVSLHIDTGRYGKIPVTTDYPEVDHLNAIFKNGRIGQLKGNYVIGGDFNADPVAYPEHMQTFNWLKDNGFLECLKQQTNTYFGYKRKATIQDDHFLVPPSMMSFVTNCHALEYEKVKQFSDHTIIEMELRI